MATKTQGKKTEIQELRASFDALAMEIREHMAKQTPPPIAYTPYPIVYQVGYWFWNPFSYRYEWRQG